MDTSMIKPAIFTAIFMLFATEASADNVNELTTGHAHMVRVIRQASMGIEAEIPHQSAYGRALELDRQGQYHRAYLLFRQASQEFQRLSRQRPYDKRIHIWILKANQQRSISYSLHRMRRYKPRYYRYGRYRSIYRLYNYAMNSHLKWLAIRAFGLRAPKKLVQDAIKFYREILKLRSRYTIAQLRLAGLYAELHDTAKARALTPLPLTRRLSSNEQFAAAYYFATIGEADKALALIAKIVRASRWRRKRLYLSNFFDSLREDPRFLALVAPK